MNRGARSFGAVLLFSLGWIGSAGPAGATIHVDASAPGSNDGSSWTNAFTDLQSALAAAAAGDTVRVAGGTYVPGPDRADAFGLPSTVVLLGSFGGYSSPTPDERDFDGTPSVLTGEIGDAARDDNCYNVVVASGTTAGTTLDGFVVTRGHAWGSVSTEQRGGGMYIASGGATVRNVRFVDNQSQWHGAGMHSTSGTITLENVEFRDGVAGAWGNGHGGGLYADGSAHLSDCSVIDNTAESQGGGMFFYNGQLVLERCVFEGNSAYLGGGLRVGNCDLTIVDSEFRYNSVSDDGGALWTGEEQLRVVNTLFWRNSAGEVGGAVKLCCFGSQGPQEFTNCTFAENEAGSVGALFVSHNGTPLLTNCIFWADTGDWYPAEIAGGALISHCIVAGSGGSGAPWDSTLGIDGGGNLDADPAFEFMVLGNLRITPGSPAVDAGDPGAPNLPTHDLDGNPRILGATVDMGAYELVGPAAVGPSIGGRGLAVHPNPARSDVSVSFELRRPTEVSLSIYDVRGRLVRQLVSGTREAGTHHAIWDREGAHGPAAPGVYFVRFRTGAASEARRLVILR